MAHGSGLRPCSATRGMAADHRSAGKAPEIHAGKRPPWTPFHLGRGDWSGNCRFVSPVDSGEVEQVGKESCVHCDGGVLHVARYEPMPTVVPVSLRTGEDGLVHSHGSCRGHCRQGTTPVTVRSFYRRQYVHSPFVLLPVLLGGRSPWAVLSSYCRLCLNVRTRHHGCREASLPSRFWRATQALPSGEAIPSSPYPDCQSPY